LSHYLNHSRIRIRH